MPKRRQFPSFLCVLIPLAFAMSGAFGASAGQISLTIRDAEGAPVADAVVTLQPRGGSAKNPAVPGKTRSINQHQTTYDPFVTVIPAGTAVAFVNADPWRHHVYSFSKSKRFDIKVEAAATSNPVVFDKPGIVVIGCNIHDPNLAYIYVSDAGVSRKSDKDGVVRFEGLAAGDYRLTTWHPRLRSKAKLPAIGISVKQTGVTESGIVVKLKSPRKKKKMKRY